jgi:hypothetical protein
VDDPSEVMGSE